MTGEERSALLAEKSMQLLIDFPDASWDEICRKLIDMGIRTRKNQWPNAASIKTVLKGRLGGYKYRKNPNNKNIEKEFLRVHIFEIIRDGIKPVAEKLDLNHETLRHNFARIFPMIYKNKDCPRLKRLLLTTKDEGVCSINVGGKLFTIDRKFYHLAMSTHLTNNGKDYLKTRYGYWHRFVIGAKNGEEVDHIDGNKTNNTVANLRICTRSQNVANRRSRGYTIDKRKLTKVYAVTLGGRKYFETEERAKTYYQEQHRLKYGEFSPYFRQ